jgi:hypothetical protein
VNVNSLEQESSQYLHFLPGGQEAFEPPLPAQSFLHAQYWAESLLFFSEHLWRALNDLRAAAL